MIKLAGMVVYIRLVEKEISPASRSHVLALCDIPLTACRRSDQPATYAQNTMR